MNKDFGVGVTTGEYHLDSAVGAKIFQAHAPSHNQIGSRERRGPEPGPRSGVHRGNQDVT